MWFIVCLYHSADKWDIRYFFINGATLAAPAWCYTSWCLLYVMCQPDFLCLVTLQQHPSTMSRVGSAAHTCIPFSVLFCPLQTSSDLLVFDSLLVPKVGKTHVPLSQIFMPSLAFCWKDTSHTFKWEHSYLKQCCKTGSSKQVRLL